jgi:hypothetical protein
MTKEEIIDLENIFRSLRERLEREKDPIAVSIAMMMTPLIRLSSDIIPDEETKPLWMISRCKVW